MIRAFVVDDEPLAVRRLKRMLDETGRVDVAGSSSDPVDALAALSETPVDLLFLDIQMPGMTGFEMLGMMDPQPLVVFTTAFDQTERSYRSAGSGRSAGRSICSNRLRHSS